MAPGSNPMTNVDCVQAVMPCNMWQEMTQQWQPYRPDISSSGIAVLSPLILPSHTTRDTCLYAARLPGRFLYPSNTPVTRVCTQRDSQDAYDTCFVLSRTFCPARATANTWQSYSKSVVVPLAYVVPRVCTRRRSRPRRGCTSESKRTHRAGCQCHIKPPSVPATASPRPLADRAWF